MYKIIYCIILNNIEYSIQTKVVYCVNDRMIDVRLFIKDIHILITRLVAYYDLM